MWCLIQSAWPSLLFHHILWPSSYECWANFDFSSRLCQVNEYFQMSACFANATSATVTWDIVHTLLRQLGIPNRFSVHQYPTDFMFRFENCPDIETVPNESEFLGDTVNIWDNDSALVYCV
jgi:hypothetical protein